jgi:hypothetical protein
MKYSLLYLHMSEPAPTFSVSIIDTLNHDTAWNTLWHSVEVLDQVVNLTRIYWYSDQSPPDNPRDERLEWVKTKIIEVMPDDYNSVMFDKMGATAVQDFNFVVQTDGYPCNVAAWTNEFLKYDYIGAVWPWTTEKVGNGGFSLRSRKLLESLAQLDTAKWQSVPEDNTICIHLRSQLESEFGVRFAPAELADQFSIELNTSSSWFGRSFGFHGKCHVTLYPATTII